MLAPKVSVFCLSLALSVCHSALAQPAATQLSVALYPYLPDGESAIEQLESTFEAYAQSKGTPVDLDLEFLDSYSKTQEIHRFDVAEIDLCMLDELRQNGSLMLDEIPDTLRPASRTWVGPASVAMSRADAKRILPHWICGNFLVSWTADDRLNKALTFEQVLAALDPQTGRDLFADLWGGSTLGEFYADAVLDLYGADEARKHLLELAVTPEPEVRLKLRSDAVLALWRMTNEMRREHRQNRSKLHNLSFVYPRAFATESDSCLIGYSERLHFLERQLQEQPWLGRNFPVETKTLTVRQFPFGDKSQGTPMWVDAFVIPEGKLAHKKYAIMLFLEFVISDSGYQTFLEPRAYYPAAYLLPACEQTYESTFVKTKMPAIESYRKVVDSSFPMLEVKLYRGLDSAGEQLKLLLKPADE